MPFYFTINNPSLLTITLQTRSAVQKERLLLAEVKCRTRALPAQINCVVTLTCSTAVSLAAENKGWQWLVGDRKKAPKHF